MARGGGRKPQKAPARKKAKNPEDEDREDNAEQPHIAVTPEMLKQLKNVDIKNYPIPENLNAAYKMDGKQRLMIEKMVVENFKSYYGQQVIGPFHPHFSAIIGANGSGKSNIIDALMFVFGSKCSKIRSTNVKALIHKSAAHQNLSHCSVTIFFVLCQDEDNGKYSFVPGSNFNVKRTVTSSGVSKYFYNEDKYGRDDLRQKLRMHGIDMDHNRFLILQGEVESISTMKPKAEKENDKGLLEYLDDIIGTSRLRKKVMELDMTIIAVDAERQKQLMKVQEYDKMRHKLVNPVREIVQILIVDNKLAHRKHKLLSIQIHRDEKSVNKARNRKDELDAILIQENEQLKQIVDGNTEAKAFVKRKTKELEEAQNSQRKQKEQLDREQMNLKRTALNLEKAEKIFNDKQKEKSKLEETIKKFENRPTKNADEAEKLKDELEEVKAKIEELRTQLQAKNKEANDRTAELEKERVHIGEGLAEAKKDEDEANSQLLLAQSTQMRMREPLEKAQRRYDESRRDIEKLEETFAEEEKKIKETTDKLSSLEPRCNNLKDQFESLTQREKEFSSKYSACKREYDTASKEQSSSRTHNSTIEKLMEEKRSGRIPGICGRLGDLGNIDPKYDVAISTTTNLDYIVTDTFDTAKECLSFMEKSNLPRLTFLSLDKVQVNRDGMQPMQTPKNYPRLYDLVKPIKPEYAIAFYFALRDTIVCDDIVKAREVADWNGKRWRVVTLGADLIESAGTLTGGGTTVRRGKIGTNVNAAVNAISEADVANLKRKMEKYQEEYEKVRDQLQRLKVEKTEVSTSYEREKNYLQKLRASYKQHEDDLKFAKTNIIRLQTDLDKEKAVLTDEHIQNVKAKVQNLAKERDDLSIECETIQEKYDSITSQIAIVFDKIGGSIKTTFDQYQKEEKDVEQKLAELRKASSKAEIDLKKSTNNLKAVLQKIEDAEHDIEKSTSEKEESEQIIERLEALLKEKDEFIEKIEAEIKEESERAEQNNEDEVQLKKSIKENKAEMDALKIGISRYIDKINEYVAKRKLLKLHNIGDLLDDEAFKKKPKKKAKIAKDDNSDSELSDTDMEVDDDGDVPMEVDKSEGKSVFEEDDLEECRLTEFVEYTPEQIESTDVRALEDDYEEYQSDRQKLKTELNLNVLQEYRKRVSEFKKEESHLHDLSMAVNNVQRVYDRFVNQRLEEFTDALNKINEFLRIQYYCLSLGGEAYLQAVSPMDAYSDGIKFIVRPKSKGWREIALTSGGEKTISSLSLVFALHQYLPTPFYVMDEIDAALDFRNVAMISKFVKEKTKNSQFIIISLRDNMYQLANSLIGVYKVQDKAHTCLLKHEVKNVNVNRKKAPIMPA